MDILLQMLPSLWGHAFVGLKGLMNPRALGEVFHGVMGLVNGGGFLPQHSGTHLLNVKPIVTIEPDETAL